nr:interferon-induced GTP-binding protein Mx2 isoform X1 [Oryctolagus cuniculus]
MSRAHRNRLQKQKSFSSRFCLKEEMSFSLQKSPPCVVGPKEWPAPPEWLAGRADPTSLPKDFNFLSLVEQQASKAKGPENNLYAQYEERVRPCIDLIDSLRALGVEQDLALPAIAVIGDQSSGKSSVLEALSGVPLPRGNGIITRCPLELKMKKQPWASRWRATVSYRDVRLQLDSPSQVEKEIRKAQKALTGSDTSISQELITLEVTSCEVPDLTLIDLPGIARLAIGGQPRDIGEQIKALIRKYIQRQETINLVVVPSNVDIATTEALSMAREVDPDGDRTIGVLTKPDLVDRGTEKGVLQVAQNLTYHLKKGYMMVRCRAQQEVLNNLSCAEAAKREMQFFEVHPHFRVLLDNGMATVPRLAERLTEELSEHISKSLPLLETQIREKHLQATEELRSCGADVPSQEADMMFFLIEKIKLFNQDIEKLVEAEEAVKEKETRMYNRVRQQFQRWAGVLTASNLRVKNNIQDEISKYENQYRGKELLGFVSYKTFETIVQQHLQQLVDPALQVLLSTVEIVQQAFCDTAAKHFSDFSNLHQIVRLAEQQQKAQPVSLVRPEQHRRHQNEAGGEGAGGDPAAVQDGEAGLLPGPDLQHSAQGCPPGGAAAPGEHAPGLPPGLPLCQRHSPSLHRQRNRSPRGGVLLGNQQTAVQPDPVHNSVFHTSRKRRLPAESHAEDPPGEREVLLAAAGAQGDRHQAQGPEGAALPAGPGAAHALAVLQGRGALKGQPEWPRAGATPPSSHPGPIHIPRACGWCPRRPNSPDLLGEALLRPWPRAGSGSPVTRHSRCRRQPGTARGGGGSLHLVPLWLCENLAGHPERSHH